MKDRELIGEIVKMVSEFRLSKLFGKKIKKAKKSYEKANGTIKKRNS